MDSVGEWSTNGEGCGYRTECSPTYPVRGVCPKGWHYEGTDAYFCSSTEGGIEGASRLILLYDDEEAYLGIDFKYFAYSVRCLKD